MNKLAVGVAVAVGLLLYIRSPIDLIPDRIGPAGFLDDLMALGIGVWWFWKRLPNLSSGSRSTGSSARTEGGNTTGGRFDAYEILGISPAASGDEIHQAYRDQLRQYHPDKVDSLGGELQKLAHRRTLDIQRAYDELKVKKT